MLTPLVALLQLAMGALLRVVTSLTIIPAICQASSSFDFSTSALVIIRLTARLNFDPDECDVVDMSGGASK